MQPEPDHAGRNEAVAELDAPGKAPPPLQDARRGRFKVNLFGAGGTKDRMNIANESTGANVGGRRRLCSLASWAARITQFNVFAPFIR
jgi:hypothetical protein